MIYEALLLIGIIGLAAQAVLGMSHSGAGHGAAGHGGGAVSSGGAGHAQVPGVHVHGHVNNSVHGHGHLHVHMNGRTFSREMVSFLLPMLSPLAIFSLCAGAGAAGMIAQALREKGAVVVVAAIVGAFVFYGLLVRPLWNLMLKFESEPAKTLAGAVATQAVAASRFDAKGRGVVRLTVDGQTTRVLAHLDAQDLEKITNIAPGDSLLVTGVDAKKNTCRVTPL